MRRLLASLRADLRQRRHHRAFRIGPPGWDDERYARLEGMLAALEETEKALDGLDEKLLADAATNLFTASRKLSRPGQDGRRLPKEARDAGRWLVKCDETLARAGLRIQGHDGDAYHPGRSLRALGFEDHLTLETETVVQTMRPTIYLHGRRIQIGEVIVGRPAGTDPPDAPDSTDPPNSTDTRATPAPPNTPTMPNTPDIANSPDTADPQGRL
ncbi:hypothetical protein OHR68_36305 [Spirillospora sp. NBC_00431]